jgi:hypothetical protein
MFVYCWNRRETVEEIIRMTTPPTPGNSRFLIYPRTTTPVEPEDVVLIDRLTGRWWLRWGSLHLQRDTEVMGMLIPV